MAKARVNFYGRTSFGIDIVAGFTIEPRLDVPAVAATFNATPSATIAANVKIVEFFADADTLVFCGPAATSNTLKQSQARFCPASHLLAMGTLPGDHLHIWTA